MRFSLSKTGVWRYHQGMLFVDAHIHPYDLAERMLPGAPLSAGQSPAGILHPDTLVCASAWRFDEFEWNEKLKKDLPGSVALSFGVHPQLPDSALIPVLETLADQGRIDAIGECGFDLFPEYREQRAQQDRVWKDQLDIAARYRLPLIIHVRKAMDRIFADTQLLAALPAVVFHGWPGSVREAHSILDRGVNAWFSCGKGLLRGQRSLIAVAREVPVERLLTETDAPWMAGKGEEYSHSADISRVFDALCTLRGCDPETTARILEKSFRLVFFGS